MSADGCAFKGDALDENVMASTTREIQQKDHDKRKLQQQQGGRETKMKMTFCDAEMMAA